MKDSGQRLRDLHSDGTLHRRLLIRVRLLSVIAILLLGIAAYDALRVHLLLVLCVAFAAIGFVLGVTVFSRMSKVVWDEEEETISTGRMDIAGVLALVLYIAFDIGVRRYLAAEFSGISSVTGYVLATLGGALLGRSIGTRRAIYRRLAEQGKPAEISA